MNGKVVRLVSPPGAGEITLRARLENISAVFKAIHAGELLSALPDCPIARGDHIAALTLLGVAESEVYALCDELGTDRREYDYQETF